MRSFLTILITCLVLCTFGTLGLLVWQSSQQRTLQVANTQLTGELLASRNAVTEITREKDGLREKIAVLETNEAQLRERVTTLESAAQSAVNAPPRPYRVRTFVGRENVGEAWMMPHNVTRDPESGRYVFEPVLWIDESAKGYFTEHHTNTVEREVYTTEIVQDSYAYPYYYYVTPGRPGRPGKPPVQPEHPVAPKPPAPGTPTQPDARAQVFAPPLTTINSRPQVIGSPQRTSPINERVFAP